jgi:CheY-like chemotaxis protein
MNKALKLIVAAALAGTMAGAVHAADLLSVYHDAVIYDAPFSSARATLDAGREKVPQGRAGLLPSIGLGASTTWNETESTRRVNGAAAVPADYNSNGWTVTLTQPVFRWQNWLAYNQAELAVAISEAQFGAARMDLIARTAQAYFDVLLAQDALATAQTQKAATAAQLESARRNFDVGTATITDSHEAQARFDLITAQELAAQNDLTVKGHALQMLTGKHPETLKRLRQGVILAPPQPADLNRWVELAETGAATVQVAQVSLEIAQREIEKQRAGHYPTLDLVATHGNSAQSYSSTFCDLVILDLMLPGDDGLTLCRVSCAPSPSLPILMLTARGEDTDRIVGLEMGADDYLPKPFNPRELLARIKSILRRAGRAAEPRSRGRARFAFAGWTLDLGARHLVGADGVVVPLSGGEYKLLRVFAENPLACSRATSCSNWPGARPIPSTAASTCMVTACAGACATTRASRADQDGAGEGYMLAAVARA